MSGLRTYEFEHEYGCTNVSAPEKSCFFCSHCTDIFFDYTRGPYMFICELDEYIVDGLNGECVKFAEDGDS
jgi:hypothetical protein